MDFQFSIDVNPSLDESNKTDVPKSKNSIVQKLMEEYRKEKESEAPKRGKKAAPVEKVDLFSRAMGWVDKNGDVVSLTDNKNSDRNYRRDDQVKDRESIDKLLATSKVLDENFEKLHAVPNHSDYKLREMRRKERAKTKGDKWFNLPATEVTEEVKKDLEVLQMRSVLDPKHFYKKNDLKVLPKYFQIGQVVDSPVDYYNSRLTKKERKKTLVDELLADAQFNKYNKKKYAEIVTERQKTHYKAYRQAKKLKRKKK